MEQIEGLERIAGLTPEGVLTIAIIFTLVVVVMIVFLVRNQNTSGLTDAVKSLTGVIQSSQSFQISMETEFRRLVGSLTELLTGIRDIQTMKEEVSMMHQVIQEQNKLRSNKVETQEAMLIRLDNMDRQLDIHSQKLSTIVSYITKGDSENA